jgi:endonuclease/exonuclease/phosphatase (EEP) superfamily protein YafD
MTAAGCLALLGSVAGFLGRYAWWLDIGSHFRVQYTVLFVVLTVCYLVGKKRGWALACLLLAIINFLPVASYRFPARGYEQVAGPSLKVALMNVNSELGKPDEVARFLQRENPDVIILEEINDEWMRRLSPFLNGYPGRIVQTREDNFGIGVFSRARITSSKVVYFGKADVPSIIARMELNGQAFTLVATHPLPPGGAEHSRMRNEQLDCVAGYVSTNHDPLILLGDLNITPWSPLYRDFIWRSGLVNSSQGRAIHPSWPSFSPLFLIPIDHCLHNAGIAIKSERVGKSVGSDHYPVIVEFGLKDGGDLLPWNARTYSDYRL